MSARDENLEQVAKIDQLTIEIDKLKAANRCLSIDLDRALTDIQTLKIKYDDSSPAFNDSPGKIFQRRPPSIDICEQEKSRTLESLDVRPVIDDSTVDELRKTILVQDQMINALRQAQRPIESRPITERSMNTAIEDTSDFKLDVDMNDIKRYSKHAMKKSGIPNNVDYHLMADDLTQRNYGGDSRREIKSELNLTPTKVKHKLPIVRIDRVEDGSASKQVDSREHFLFNDANRGGTTQGDAQSIDDLSMSFDHNEREGRGRSQTHGHNISADSSSAHFEMPDDPLEGTPHFAKQMLTPAQMLANTKDGGRQRKMDDIDALSEKKPSNDDRPPKTNRLKLSKDQLNAKGAIFSQFYKNFRNTPKKRDKSDFSKDYLAVMIRSTIRDYLNRIQDPSTKVFSDAISVFRHPNRKYQYILVVTCKHL